MSALIYPWNDPNVVTLQGPDSDRGKLRSMRGKRSGILSSVQVPVLEGGVRCVKLEFEMRDCTIASPSQPALKNPFSSCCMLIAETGLRWPGKT